MAGARWAARSPGRRPNASRLSIATVRSSASPRPTKSPFCARFSPSRSPGLAAKTWARLADGTPLVTADRRGKGLIVLFHVTADTTWSNLPLSGLFVDMLRKIVALAGQAPAPDKDASASAASVAEANHAPVAHARRVWRARAAAGHRQADRGEFLGRRRRRPSARLLRFGRRA